MEKTTENAASSINRELQKSILQIGDGTSGLRYLQNAKGLIAEPSRWVQHAESTDENGTRRYSLLGALKQVDDQTPQYQAAMRAVRSLTGADVQKWNDRFWRKHPKVLRVLDRAMAITWHS